MKNTKGALDRAADRLMGADSPTYGDERERAVFMEASTFGNTIGIYVSLAAALVAALLGQVLLPVVLLLVMATPTWVAMWYASRRDVDISAMADLADRRTKVTVAVVTFGGIVLVGAAMLYTVMAGHGVIPVPDIDLGAGGSDGVGASMVRGGLIGAIGGGLVAAVLSVRGSRKRARATEPLEDEVDDFED
ncbi:hypothetical protein [Georgenia wangjunii]|uniref:hypothetical protein n=1 Tax=Georgenia wangjunii TaxID=3117730 RepID=UPI002F25EE3C